MDNREYYLLCVMEMDKRFRTGEPFSSNELSYHSDIDKSDVNKSLKVLNKNKFVKLINNKPKLYTFNLEMLEKWKK